MIRDDTPKKCPKCKVILRGTPIPQDMKDKYYGGSTHFSRVIGLSNWDSITDWLCPDCGHKWKRKRL